jgi:hypothetical protein
LIPPAHVFVEPARAIRSIVASFRSRTRGRSRPTRASGLDSGVPLCAFARGLHASRPTTALALRPALRDEACGRTRARPATRDPRHEPEPRPLRRGPSTRASHGREPRTRATNRSAEGRSSSSSRLRAG